jgi:ribosomal protein L37AE/L43A
MSQYDEQNEREEPDCPICRGRSYELGQFGRLVWFACRYCGWQHSSPADKNCHVTEYQDLTFSDTQTTPADKQKGTAC